MRRALLTGLTGQDGSYLAERLLADGWEVHGLVREPQAGERDAAEGAQLHRGDLRDADAVAGILTEVAPDAVFHLAGVSSVARSWEAPAETAAVTGVAVVALLDAAFRLQEQLGRQVVFVQASSGEIFGAPAEVPQTERTPIAPVSPYGAAKAFAHHCVHLYRERGLHASSAILYNHESPRRPPQFVTRKITQGVAEIAAGRSETLSLGNLDAARDWGWAPDYVDAMVRMAAHDVADDYVIATGEAHTVREFVAAAFAAAGVDDWEPRVTVDPRFLRPNDAPLLVGDSSKARATLGWAPTRSFEEIVSAMVQHDLESLGS